MRILLIGHACGPGLGSEPGNTWNLANALARQHEVWVLAYPEHRASVERHLANNPNPNLHFEWVVTDHSLDPWKPERGERGVRFHYLLWIRKAYRRAEELCRTRAIDVAHHVSLATVGAPPPMWRLPVARVWGPIGGGQTTSPAYLPLFGRQRWVERVRTMRVHLLSRSRTLRRTTQSCDKIFATNPETLDFLKQAGAHTVELFLDCGLPSAVVPRSLPASHSPVDALHLLWAGRIEPRKGLALGLRALAQLPQHLPVRLAVAGSGPEEAAMHQLARELQISDRVTFLGRVPFAEMAKLFQTSSAFLFTSVRDSSGSVVLEAMAHGLPVITLSHQGIGYFVPGEASVKIEPSGLEQTVAELARSIERLAVSPSQLAPMRQAAWIFAQQQTWERRSERMSDLYTSLISCRRTSDAESTAISQHKPAHATAEPE